MILNYFVCILEHNWFPQALRCDWTIWYQLSKKSVGFVCLFLYTSDCFWCLKKYPQKLGLFCYLIHHPK